MKISGHAERRVQAHGKLTVQILSKFVHRKHWNVPVLPVRQIFAISLHRNFPVLSGASGAHKNLGSGVSSAINLGAPETLEISGAPAPSYAESHEFFFEVKVFTSRE